MSCFLSVLTRTLPGEDSTVLSGSRGSQATREQEVPSIPRGDADHVADLAKVAEVLT
jgi:hypothetical protein